ncbi:MAG: hydroxyacid dehydrogenase [Alphaproteobacteria bacterium]|nr:MAG: hydroxyacid dehydrogenase [Alphaproteobacteria bacterium]
MTNIPRKVVVTQKFFDQGSIEYLESNGFQVDMPDLPDNKSEGQLTAQDIQHLLAGAGGWIVGHANITREVLSCVPDLAIISRRGVGYEKVDVKAARDLGKVVTIAAGGNDATVADQVIGMMISLGRRFREAQNAMINGNWKILVGHDLCEKTVGIFGFGRIGRSLAKRLQGFDARILVCTPRLSDADIREFGLEPCDFETLLQQSDYLSLHAPLTPETRHIVDAAALGKMKETAILINTARGGLVDDRALLAALKECTIMGAGLDVFESESNPDMLPVTKELIARDEVLAAPHAGASTLEGLNRTNMIAAQCVVAVADGESPPAACIVVDGRGQ